MLKTYRQRLTKLMMMIMVWRHYILTYYKEREEKFYLNLYKNKRKNIFKSGSKGGKSSPVHDQGLPGEGSSCDTNESNFSDQLEEGPFGLGLSAEKTEKVTKQPVSPEPEIEDTFSKINIHFFIEEYFLYILEILHTIAGMAYT